MSSEPAPVRHPRWFARDSSGRLDTLQHDFAAASPIRAHVFVMALLFGVALFVAYVLLPGDSERIEFDHHVRIDRLGGRHGPVVVWFRPRKRFFEPVPNCFPL